MRKEENDLIHRGTYDGTIYYNPANKFCIISVKTAEKDVPEEARSIRRRKDHLIRFVATGYELPRTDAVELELDGEWKKGKYGMQLQVEQWHEIVPQTKSGVEGYLASGLIKGIGPALAKQIVSRFGVETLDILQNRPERLLEIKGITENKLEAIKTSYAESRMLQDLMTLLSPFKITPKTAQKIYQFFGPASVDILKKSPFELCQISGFGFLRVDAIVQKNGGDLRAPMRIKGALFWALEDSKGKNGHLFLTSEALQKEALQLLNAKIPIPSLRLHAQEVSDVLEDMILHGEVVSVKGDIYLPRVFAQEDETARRIAMRVVEPPAPEKIEQILEQVKREIGLALSSKQEAAVYATYRHNLSIITGSPGTGKTTVLKTILEVYQKLWFRMAHPNGRMRLTAMRITEQMAIFEAKVFLDRSDAEPFSVSVAQQTMQDSRDFVKAAQNEALSQALSDAGFGIQLVSADTHAASVQKAAPVSKTQPSAITPPVSTVLPQEPSSASQKAAVLSEGNSVSGGTQTPQRASENAETARTKIQPAATPAHEQSLPVSPTTNTDTLPADSAPTTEQPENSKTAEELPIHLPAEELPVQRPAEDLTVAKEAQEVPEAKVVQEAPAYTPDMPVEDILKVMTLEQAQEVVVDSGVCRGLTIAEVAKKRPVNLRFYLTPGNKSKDNIVRAAAQLVLNSLQKAG